MMNMRSLSLLFGVLACVVMLTGCTPHYVITTEMQENLPSSSTWTIGAVTDQLPPDFDPAKKPSAEDIESFKEELRHQLQKQDIETGSEVGTTMPTYEIQGGILDYKKGNGFLRFLFGSWAGSAKLVVDLKVINTKSNSTAFAGNFTGRVTDWSQSGKKMWEDVAKDFAKAIKKERKRLAAPAPQQSQAGTMK